MAHGAKVRDARLQDAGRILEIYAHYVKNTAVTFECGVPAPANFRARMERTMARYPYLVAEEGDTVQGFAYAGPLSARKAYDWSCETTVYLHPDARGRGWGRRLYEELGERLREMGVTNLYACVARPESPDEYLDERSLGFHAHMGFERVGEFHACGHKFGRWYNVVWMEKVIGRHVECQPPVAFPEA